MNANLNEAAADLETLAKEGKHPPEHGPYRIKVNGTPHVVQGPTITVAEIIALAGKQPADAYWVFRRKHGHQEPNPLPPNQPIDLREHGVESFVVLPKHNPDGLDNPRRDFTLSARDIATLEALGLPWEAVREGNVCYLLIYGFPLPEGYTAKAVDVAITVEAGYPDTKMDMASFSPALIRTNGRDIIKTSSPQFCGRSWQQWSRHRQEQDKWMPGVDDLATHLACVRMWLTAEVTR
jgi:hypothetical protein